MKVTAATKEKKMAGTSVIFFSLSSFKTYELRIQIIIGRTIHLLKAIKIFLARLWLYTYFKHTPKFFVMEFLQ